MERESFLDFNVGPGLFWGWGWLALVGIIILLGILLLPWFFFLLNLQALLGNIDPANRRMSPGKVWLNFIPVFQLGWFIYTVIKIRESLEAEFKARQWFVDGDLGYNVGLTAGILWIASFFIGWIPFFGWLLAVGGIVCWIIYWLRVSDLKSRFDVGPAWNPAPARSTPGFGYPPYAVRYPHVRASRPAPGAAEGDTPPPVEQSAEGSAAETPAGERRAGERRKRERRRSAKRSDEVRTAEQAPAEPVELRCEACGASHDEGDWFCRKCGARLL